MNKKPISPSLILLASALVLIMSRNPACGVTINIDAEGLKTSTGDPMPISGLVILAASTLDASFGNPTASSFFGGDDIEVGRWDLTSFGVPGAFQGMTGSLIASSVSANWTVGDPLQLLWFPTLTLGSLAPGAGTSFGQYRNDTGLDGSAAWLTPSDSSTISLKFFTEDASFLNGGGSNPSSSGMASFSTPIGPGSSSPGPSAPPTSVPESSSGSVLASITFLALAGARKFLH
ncbi:MAG: hypothetical protein K9N62_00975 [Verrucomicrobia bacterium]|nr:hypothetical protein [Verrucomicrobiota bacterium]